MPATLTPASRRSSSTDRAGQRDPDLTFDFLANSSPLGYEAGDLNLYRYVGNNPANATDPSGLETGAYVQDYVFPDRNQVTISPAPHAAPPIGTAAIGSGGWVPKYEGIAYQLGGPYTAVVRVSSFGTPNVAAQEQVVVAVRKAAERIALALDAIENNPKGVERFYEISTTHCRYLRVKENREQLKEMLLEVDRTFRSSRQYVLQIQIDAERSGVERDAYVNFVPFTNMVLGSVIHVTPDFFQNLSHDRQVDVMQRELGRFFNGLGETGTETWGDADLWDSWVRSPAENHAEIVRLNH